MPCAMYIRPESSSVGIMASQNIEISLQILPAEKMQSSSAKEMSH
jgi:hypothetical protein